MSRVHRAVAGRIEGPARAVFVDTPAGFEPNVGDIAAKAVEYLQRRVGLRCEVCSCRIPGDAGAALRAGLRRLERANYVFAGPGSPTYAVRTWRDSAVFEAMGRRLAAGAQLVFASAAAIAVGARALPVYEIFKAGAPLHWVAGLDLLGAYGLRLAVVPHWNNAEGSGYDTRFCFMGEERFERLRRALEPTVTVLGVDEYTACILDLAAEACAVLGAGQVTVQNDAGERSFGPGETFSLALLRGAPLRGRAGSPSRPRREAEDDALQAATARARGFASSGWPPADHEAVAAVADALAAAVTDARAAGLNDEAVAEAEDALRDLLARWLLALAPSAGGEDARPYVDLLVRVRDVLRERRQFDLADLIRDGLGDLGVSLEDGPAGTTWARRQAERPSARTRS